MLPGTTAEKAGLRGTTQVRDGLVLGDVILAINGKKVTDYDTLRDELERHEVGTEVILTLLRDDGTVELKTPLEAMN